MRTLIKKKSYEAVMQLPKEVHRKPMRQVRAIRILLKALASVDLKLTDFTYETTDMEKLGRKEPCLILMNHSSFIDLEIVAYMLADREYHIVCTQDAFVGLGPILRLLGCISTRKFINDIQLVKDMHYTVKELKGSILMYPEASYSFDGTATPLPDSLGKCIKLLKIPVVMIQTEGAFIRDPLYNGLQRRKTKVSAKMKYLLSPEEIEQKSVKELNAILKESFTFDNLRLQQEKQIHITEKFRADGLHRVLYRCSHCETEGRMYGEGTHITCKACNKKYELTETGYLQAVVGQTRFSHIPDWYQWERECVRKELESDTYELSIDVKICMLVNTKNIYEVGEGHLWHNKDGFRLTGCDGQIDYRQSPQASYGLYSDFNWYEIGDMICIGDEQIQYYCFPKKGENVVAKTRLAAEELYKMGRRKNKTD